MKKFFGLIIFLVTAHIASFKGSHRRDNSNLTVKTILPILILNSFTLPLQLILVMEACRMLITFLACTSLACAVQFTLVRCCSHSQTALNKSVFKTFFSIVRINLSSLCLPSLHMINFLIQNIFLTV